LREVVFNVAEQSASNARFRKLMEIAAKYPAAREAQLSRFAGLQDQLAQAFGRRCKDTITAYLLAGLGLRRAQCDASILVRETEKRHLPDCA
jgi:hypothetical protein